MIRKLPIGIEMYGVRDLYGQDPIGTLRKLKQMGYEGVELYGGEANNLPAPEANDALDEIGLTCFSYQPNWEFVQDETFERTLRFAEEMRTHRIGVAAAPAELVNHRAGLECVIAHLNKLNGIAQRSGFQIGYHAHKSDFVEVDGMTAWDRIFENTPKEFVMVLDTGNALSGDAWSIPLLEKFPGRSPWLHLKPYSLQDQGATMIGEDAFDWSKLLDACVNLGKADTLIIEYSNARYAPMEASRICLNKLSVYMA